MFPRVPVIPPPVFPGARSFPQGPRFPGAPAFGPHTAAYNAGFAGGLFIGALVMGMVCGLLPLLVARARGRQSFGVIGLIVCSVAGLIGGVILALPTGIIMAIIAVALPDPRQ